MVEEKVEEKCMLVLIVLIYSGRLVAVPPGGMMSVLWPGSQPAPHKHGEGKFWSILLMAVVNFQTHLSTRCHSLYSKSVIP